MNLQKDSMQPKNTVFDTRPFMSEPTEATSQLLNTWKSVVANKPDYLDIPADSEAFEFYNEEMEQSL